MGLSRHCTTAHRGLAYVGYVGLAACDDARKIEVFIHDTPTDTVLVYQLPGTCTGTYMYYIRIHE